MRQSGDCATRKREGRRSDSFIITEALNYIAHVSQRQRSLTVKIKPVTIRETWE